MQYVMKDVSICYPQCDVALAKKAISLARVLVTACHRCTTCIICMKCVFSTMAAMMIETLPQVRYELLDCSHAFLEAVIKLVSLMESGVVRGSERLVPHLFHFLVLLANDNSKLVTVPEVSHMTALLKNRTTS